MAIHSSILAWRIPQSVYSPWGLKESERTEQLAHSQQVELPKPGVELMPPAEETQSTREPLDHQGSPYYLFLTKSS